MANTAGFLRNAGQWPSDVVAQTKIDGGYLWLTHNGPVYQFYSSDDLSTARGHCSKSGCNHLHTHNKINKSIRATAIRFGSNIALTTQSKFDSVIDYPTFFHLKIGNNPISAKALTYTKVEQTSPNTGTKFIWYRRGETIKYDLIIDPKLQQSLPKWTYLGADSVRLVGDRIRVYHRLGFFDEALPKVYYSINNQELLTEARFKIFDDSVSIEFLGNTSTIIPQNSKLVIDPTLVFASYSGSTSDNWGNAATYDINGNAYLAGIVFAPGFPVTTGAYDISFNGSISPVDNIVNFDVSIMKFNPSGSQVLYASYFGGRYAETPVSLITDSQGNLIVLGLTSSTNLPTTLGAYQPTHRGGERTEALSTTYVNGTDYFIAKLSANGSNLLACTYLGGSGNEGLMEDPFLTGFVANYGDAIRSEIGIDKNDNIYVAGITWSRDFPILKNGNSLSGIAGGTDGFLTSFNPSLSSYRWGWNTSGRDYETSFSFDFDTLGHIYVTGITNNPLNNTNGYNTNPILTRDINGYIAKLRTSDGSIVQILNEIRSSIPFFVRVRPDQGVALYGSTKNNFTPTAGTYSNSGGNMFVRGYDTVLNSDFATRIGASGSGVELVPTAFMVDDCENIYISGWGGQPQADGYETTSTTGLPTTQNAIKTSTDGSDFYLAVLGPEASSLKYATFFGGNNTTTIGREHVDGGTSRFDKRGIVYQAVCAGCGGANSFPASGTAVYKNNRSDNCNSAIFKLDFNRVEVNYNVTPDSGCAPLTITLRNQTKGNNKITIDFGDGYKLTTSDTVLQYTYRRPGVFKLSVSGDGGADCYIDTNSAVNIYADGVPPYRNQTYDFCVGNTLEISIPSTPNTWYKWEPLTYIISTNIDQPKITIKPQSAISYTITYADSGGCDTLSTIINLAEKPVKASFDIVPFYPNCQSYPSLNLTSTSVNNTNVIWMENGKVIGESDKWVESATKSSERTIKLIAYKENCFDSTEQKIILTELNVPNIVTPNNDNRNELFVPELANQQVEIEIYNRWGTSVLKSKNYDGKWPLKHSEQGIYFYYIKINELSGCKGWIHLIH